MSDSRRILGIDPGSRKTGFGVLDFADNAPRYVTSGTVKSAGGSFPERLKQIYSSVRQIVSEYQPDIVAIESVFMHRNASKQQVQHMVVRLLSLDGAPAEDAADALAAALCHGHQHRIRLTLESGIKLAGTR